MPPVLGPVSPSPIRLWSWAIGNATAVVPSQSTIRVHSGPCMRSSSRNDPVAAADSIARSVAASPSGTATPLPPANPSSFTTTGTPSSRHHATAAARLGEPGEAGAGDAEFGGERPGIGLRRFELGELSGRPEARQPAPGTFVGDARRQRGLGAGDDEIDVGRAGLAEIGGHDHVVTVAATRPGDGRFAAPATDDEHPHQAIARSVRSGTGPE